MRSTIQNKPARGKRIWVAALIVLLVVAGAGGYYFWSLRPAPAAEEAGETLQTSPVRQGSITVTVSGSGILVAGKERALGFSTSGTVAEVTVEVGDVVREGQVLAQLSDLESLHNLVSSARQDLVTAQAEAETLQANAAANLAQAQIAVADAQEALDSARSGVIQEGWTRCDQDSIDAYYSDYQRVHTELEALGDGGGDSNYYFAVIVPKRDEVARAQSLYEYCLGYADYEISASQAALTLAEFELQEAQARLALLTENGGVDPAELAAAENKVANAQLALNQAEAELAGATLTAPFDGTILAVEGVAGDSVGAGTFITLADLAHPRVEFSADETDLDKLFVGEQATVTFDALSGRSFTGVVTRINPALESAGGYQVVTGLIELDLSQESDVPRLPQGLNASVELVQAAAENALLVPVQAVRDLGDGSYAVFVLDEAGQPRLRLVEVGVQNAASAEIKSGVSLGDVVTTGVMETQ
ncbi:MAG TPA: efflux RND transporter periplasmic adaptor subunit [Anaerolineaceae bacterium]|nr:efflux RND transporter periplasmic adaptor subunit [Anaerolineaceae bacterium]